MQKTILLAAAAILLAAGPAPAQATISEGMSGAQVRAAFGAPATTRAAGDWTYWYYHNGCPRRCGSDDVVFFRDDRVIAAVLRTPARRFSGPPADRALDAAGATADREGTGMYIPAASAPVTVGGVRVESVRPEEFIVGPGGATEFVVSPPETEPADEGADAPTTSVDRAHERNLERAQERETATERARRIRESQQQP
jgi:hypothetical protein